MTTIFNRETLTVAIQPPVAYPTLEELITLIYSGDLSAIRSLIFDQPLDFFAHVDNSICAQLLHHLIAMKETEWYLGKGNNKPFVDRYIAITDHIREHRSDANRIFGELCYILANLDAVTNDVFYAYDEWKIYVPQDLKIAYYFNGGRFEESLNKEFSEHIQDIIFFIRSGGEENQVRYCIEIYKLFSVVFTSRWKSEYYPALIQAEATGAFSS